MKKLKYKNQFKKIVLVRLRARHSLFHIGKRLLSLVLPLSWRCAAIFSNLVDVNVTTVQKRCVILSRPCRSACIFSALALFIACAAFCFLSAPRRKKNMDITSLILELFTNADHFLMVLATEYGWFVYLAMFLIFFLETGIVVLAFLPGDSLLFVSGTVAAAGTMSPWGLMLAVILGACLGNTLGFHTGRWLGNKIYDGSISWIDIEKLRKTQIFYEKHGGKTIVLARFVPIVRAFAPLVAGAARMSMARFELYSGLGACIWAVSLIGVGYLFGNIPIVKNNLSMILLLGVIAAAMGPVVVAIGWKYVHILADKLRRQDKMERS